MLQRIARALDKASLWAACSGAVGASVGVLVWLFADTGHIPAGAIAISLALLAVPLGFIVGFVWGLLTPNPDSEQGAS